MKNSMVHRLVGLALGDHNKTKVEQIKALLMLKSSFKYLLLRLYRLKVWHQSRGKKCYVLLFDCNFQNSSQWGKLMWPLFSPLGLFLGRSRLLLSQQIVFWHWAPPGWPVQERSHPLLIAQWRPEEGDLELHPLCVRNTVRLPLCAETIKIKNTGDVQKPAFLCVCVQ